MLPALILASVLGATSERQCVTSTSRYLRAIRVNSCNVAGAATTNILLSILPDGVVYTEASGAAVTGTLGEPVTFSRASARTCTKADNSIVYLTSNQPCVANNPLGMMVDPAVTNMTPNSNNFVGGWGGTQAAIAADGSVTAPDGTTNTTRVTDTNVNNQHFISYGTSMVAGTQYTASAWVRAGTLGFAAVSVARATANSAVINLATGAITNIAAGTTARMTAGPDGWYRLAVTNTESSTGAGSFAIRLGDTAAHAASGSWIGTGSGTIYVFGAQLETGPKASRYVPTTGTAATSLAETASVANPMYQASPNDWSMAGQLRHNKFAWSGTTGVMSIGDIGAALGGHAHMAIDSTGHPVCSVTDDNLDDMTFTATAAISVPPPGARLACNVSGGTITMYLNGNLIAGSTTGTGTGAIGAHPDTIYLGTLGAAGLNALDGDIHDICVGTAGACQ